MSLVKQVERKSMEIRYSGRSTDYISPSFGFGCLLDCSYCYMKRHGKTGVTIAGNTDVILQAIDRHVHFYADVEKPNQTGPFITYDISCNEDFALHSKFHEWEKIFSFFRDHDLASASLATKIVPTKFLDFNPEGKVRIRFSLMPQQMSTIMEPNTALIKDRIAAINTFIDAGYEIHVNYSPVILYKGWLEDYANLFTMLNATVKEEYKEIVKSEVIFLTHEEGKHLTNLKNGVEGEHLLWNPALQEPKTSQYGGKNVRYKAHFKRDAIQQFKALHGTLVPWNTIRYIF